MRSVRRYVRMRRIELRSHHQCAELDIRNLEQHTEMAEGGKMAEGEPVLLRMSPKSFSSKSKDGGTFNYDGGALDDVIYILPTGYELKEWTTVRDGMHCTDLLFLYTFLEMKQSFNVFLL